MRPPTFLFDDRHAGSPCACTSGMRSRARVALFVLGLGVAGAAAGRVPDQRELPDRQWCWVYAGIGLACRTTLDRKYHALADACRRSTTVMGHRGRLMSARHSSGTAGVLLPVVLRGPAHPRAGPGGFWLWAPLLAPYPAVGRFTVPDPSAQCRRRPASGRLIGAAANRAGVLLCTWQVHGSGGGWA